MDVLGPLPEASGKVKFVIVAIDYFTKWIEAKPLAKTMGKEVKKFVWDNIERREAAAIREARYKMKMEQYYNKKVRLTTFKVGEYVYLRNEASQVENLGKLGPKWEGPYLVTEAYQNGSYKLETMAGREVPRTWHAMNLRKCYL
nr:reverse transcriptase domain-containing protein [Tanacetum cinerariifolium]